MAAFADIPKIPFEGPNSKNPLAFRFYDEKELVEGKTMKEQFRFSVAYWHTMRGSGADPFGPGTMLRPWEAAEDSVENAQNRVRVAFEFMEKLGAPFFCFHDRDVAPEGKTLAEPLQDSSIFPAMMVQMMAVGEETGSMEIMLTKIAEFYDDEVDVAVGALTSMLEPVMMVFMGGSIGTILVAMYLPIFKIADAIN